MYTLVVFIMVLKESIKNLILWNALLTTTTTAMLIIVIIIIIIHCVLLRNHMLSSLCNLSLCETSKGL